MRSAIRAVVGGLFALQSLAATGAETPLMPTYLLASVGAVRWDPDYAEGCVRNDGGATPGVAFGAFACTGAFTDLDSISGRLGAGWQFGRHFALELAYSNYGRANVERTTGNSGALPGGGYTLPTYVPLSGRYRLQGIDLSAVGVLPLGADWSLTARAGALVFLQDYKEGGSGTHGAQRAWDASESGVAAMLGVGAAYRVNRALSLRAEWYRVQRAGIAYEGWSGVPGGSTDGGHFNLDTVMLGIAYHLD